MYFSTSKPPRKIASARTLKRPPLQDPKQQAGGQEEPFDLGQIIPMWSQLKIGHQEAWLAYESLRQAPHLYEKYVNDLGMAVGLQSQYRDLVERLSFCQHWLSYNGYPQRVALAWQELRACLMQFVCLMQQARKMCAGDVYLPGYGLQNTGQIAKVLQKALPSKRQLEDVLRGTGYCIETNPRALLQRWFQAAEKAEKPGRSVYPESLYVLQFVLGLEPVAGGELARRFCQFTIQKVHDEWTWISTVQLSSQPTFAFYQKELSKPMKLLEPDAFIKVPTFGKKVKPLIHRVPGYNPNLPIVQTHPIGSGLANFTQQRINMAEETWLNGALDLISTLQANQNTVDELIRSYSGRLSARQCASARIKSAVPRCPNRVDAFAETIQNLDDAKPERDGEHVVIDLDEKSAQ